jgi:hypothetical protein
MTWRILKLSMPAAMAAAFLIGSLPAGAESRPAAKSPQAEERIPPKTAKSPSDAAKPPSNAPEAAAKPHPSDGICLGRLMEILRSRIVA